MVRKHFHTFEIIFLGWAGSRLEDGSGRENLSPSK